MERILIIVSAVFIIAGTGISFVKRSNFIKVREDKDVLNDQVEEIFKVYNDTTKPRLTETQKKYEDTNRSKLEADTELDLRRGQLTARKGEVSNVKAEQAKIAEELGQANEILTELRDFLKGIGDDITPQDIPRIVDGLKSEKRTLEEEAQSLTAELGVLRKKLEGNDGWLERYADRQQKRAVRVSRNSLEAVITAVNNDYGVVVLKAGKENGVDQDSRLLIKRGPNIVGSLSIVSVEDYMTVASINQDSLQKGAAVMPGDRVIFQDLQK